MTFSSTTTEEDRRLASLRALLVLDSAPEPVFDSIAELASRICGAPIALMSLVDKERQWFKANVGLPGVNETPRDVAFCNHAINGDSLFEVPDAVLDPRFAGNPLVTGAPDIRFYAGAPLVMECGERVGTLCVIDRRTHRLDESQKNLLSALAKIASEALEMRRDLITKSLSVRSSYEQSLRASQSFLYRTGRVAGVGGWEVDLTNNAVTWSDETRRIHEVDAAYVPRLDTAIDFYPPESRARIETAVQRGIAEGEAWDLELPFVTAMGRHIWVRTVGEVEFEGSLPVRLIGAFQDITERRALQLRLADNERFLRQITDSVPIRIAYLDRERRYRFVNQVQCDRFGKSRDEILGRTRGELTCGSNESLVVPHVDAVLQGKPGRFEFEEQVAGQTSRIESRLVPDWNERGEVQGFYVTGIDITERADAEKNQRLLAAIIDNTSDFVVQSNHLGRVVYMNRAVRKAVGMGADEPVAHLGYDAFNTPETNRRFIEEIIPAVRDRGIWLGETTVLLAEGRETPVSHMVIAQRDASGRIDNYSAVLRDISIERRTKEQLQRQAATLRSVTESIPAIVGVVGADGRYRFVNSGFERWYGAHREQVVGMSLSQVLGHAEYERVRPRIERVLAGETVNFEMDHPDRGGTRHLSVSYVPMWADGGGVDGFVSIAQDITQHRQEADRLLQLTHRDVLTGLQNRAGFEACLERCMRAGGGSDLALLYIDLDHFKPVNDRHGHAVGDEVLKVFGERLLRLVRPTDSVARLGGDEFAVALTGVKEVAHAQAVADKVVDAAHEAFVVGRLVLHIGASVGVAFGTDPARGWRELLERADGMLYRAKESGRGRRFGG